MDDVVGYTCNGQLFCLDCVDKNPWRSAFIHCSPPIYKSEADYVDCTICGTPLIESTE